MLVISRFSPWGRSQIYKIFRQSAKKNRLFGGKSRFLIVSESFVLAEESEQDTRRNGGADNTCDIRRHGVGEQVVGRVCLQANSL